MGVSLLISSTSKRLPVPFRCSREKISLLVRAADVHLNKAINLKTLKLCCFTMRLMEQRSSQVCLCRFVCEHVCGLFYRERWCVCMCVCVCVCVCVSECMYVGQTIQTWVQTKPGAPTANQFQSSSCVCKWVCWSGLITIRHVSDVRAAPWLYLAGCTLLDEEFAISLISVKTMFEFEVDLSYNYNDM